MGYKKPNLKDILKNKKHKFISMDEALKDVEPIEWSEEVIKGDKKITVSSNENE